MVFTLFQTNKKAKSAEVNNNFAFIAGERLLAVDSTTGAAYGTFDIGDLTAVVNGSLAGDWLARTGKSLKVYNGSGSLIGSVTYDSLLNATQLNSPGFVMAYAATTPPIGFLEANGALISRTVYASLFAVIGTTWGVGDGSTTFGIPDLRGDFIRGWDNGRGVDVGRAFASNQGFAFEAWTASFTVPIRTDETTISGGISEVGASRKNATTFDNTGLDYTIDPSLVAQTATETRPRNVALMYCIKY